MKKILVVEDEDVIRDFVVINLKRAGYDVVDVSCGEDALRVFEEQNQNFDVALLDIMMPGKPFSPSELVARVDAIHRRVTMAASKEVKLTAYESGPFVLNTQSRTLTKNGVPVDLTQVEFQIMELFIKNPDVALERTEILNKIWGNNYFGEVKIVDVNVRRLRMKIEDEPSSPKYLLTVWGYGYKWSGGQNS